MTPRLEPLRSASRPSVLSTVTGSDTQVYLVIGALAVVGIALLVLAGWLLGATKPERQLLAPLERMGERSWRELDPAMQRRELDDLRPLGARPISRAQDVPGVDEDFDKAVPDVADFADLTSMQAADLRRQRIGAPAAPATTTVVTAGVARADEDDDTAEATSPDPAWRDPTPTGTTSDTADTDTADTDAEQRSDVPDDEADVGDEADVESAAAIDQAGDAAEADDDAEVEVEVEPAGHTDEADDAERSDPHPG